MIETAVVLAGGFGTRLAAVVSDVPKPMAPVAGRPFLERLLDRLAEQGLQRVVLAVGYKRQIIQSHFGDRYHGMDVAYSIEAEPLGTGGAMRQAFSEQKLDRALVLNGDTFCTLDLAVFAAEHERGGAPATLSLVRVDDAGRYGAVELTDASVIAAFREKNPATGAGLINAGIYALEARVFELAPKVPKFSFEQDVLQAHAAASGFRGYVADARFIDIGIPEDYQRAQTLLADSNPSLGASP